MNGRVRSELWQVSVPLPRAFDIAVGRFDHTDNLVAVLHDEQGQAGAGYVTAFTGGLDSMTSAAVRLLEGAGARLPALLDVERGQERSFGEEPAREQRAAATAIALAAWDLVARERGVACADLWGRQPASEALPCYFSSFFNRAAGGAEFRAEAEQTWKQGYRRVKMRPGLSLEEDLDRIRAVSQIYTEPGVIALNALCTWDGEQTRAFVEQSGVSLLWLEDPVPYDAIDALPVATRSGAPVASGQRCDDVDELADLLEHGVGYLNPDVQTLGGPGRFLSAGRVLTALGARVGSHMFPYYSVHLLACLADPLPVEAMAWWDLLFENPLRPDAHGCLPVRGPGFGVDISRAALDRYGERVN
jgi:mandelate racemase